MWDPNKVKKDALIWSHRLPCWTRFLKDQNEERSRCSTRVWKETRIVKLYKELGNKTSPDRWNSCCLPEKLSLCWNKLIPLPNLFPILRIWDKPTDRYLHKFNPIFHRHISQLWLVLCSLKWNNNAMTLWILWLEVQISLFCQIRAPPSFCESDFWCRFSIQY